VAVKYGIFAVACAVLISQVVAMPLFTIWVMRKVFVKEVEKAGIR
jgi:hypothetical protein